MGRKKQKEIWVDNVKTFACILVVLGHFFQSMTKANIIGEGDLYLWFNETIYYFHVPLFFICSGYLYQRYSRIDSVATWRNNVTKKLIVLGVPYFAFSIITWVLKTVFSSSVNEQTGTLFEVLFLQPSSPYWYLYCLFFVFLVTPTITKKRGVWLVGFAIVAKVLSLVGCATSIFAITSVFQNEVWFVAGMCLGVFSETKTLQEKRSLIAGVILLGIFLFSSILSYRNNIQFLAKDFLLGSLACISIVTIFYVKYRNNVQNPILGILSRYTMPIYLMHTIFAAALRSVLIKLGITAMLPHIILGLLISFVGPILATIIMDKIKYLDFFLYPTRYVNVK